MRKVVLSLIFLFVFSGISRGQDPQKEWEPPPLNPLDEEGFLVCTKSKVEGARDCQKIYVDGTEYTVLPYGGVQVAVSLTDDGSHLVALVMVRNLNNRFSPVVDPAKTRLIGFDKDNNEVILQRIPPERVASKFINRAAWASALNALAASMAKNSTTSSSVGTANVMTTSPEGVGTATAIVSGTTTTVQPNYGVVAKADAQNAAWMAGAKANAKEVLDTELRANTLFPGNAASGFLYFERKKQKPKKLVLEVTIGNVSFDFPYGY